MEIQERYQTINLTEFSFTFLSNISDDNIIDLFIHSSHFTNESLLDIVRNNPGGLFLKQAFDMEHTKVADFKKYSKGETTKFLVDFVNEPNWGGDRGDFVKLLDRYFLIHSQLNDAVFYVISKDWFVEGDSRVLHAEYMVYIYYFLIIHIDRSSATLLVTEWTYD
ncbi:hypothetical protein [Telluribacter sp. SYSU D00476]|uniref:hypothetical protein n=1 Tax=Telluribacter sp. SYSU D00476 TaxID=2811430 RepID=UPI001FF6E452|nr:hypothetical protein [Telluribacter sp. SYSU D00476]